MPGFFLFLFFFFLEGENYTVDAVTQSGWGRAVIENMPQMCFTATTLHFGPAHTMGIIRGVDNAGFGYRLVKARPSTATVELGITHEKGIATG